MCTSQVLYASQVYYSIAPCLIKLSILALYIRIFQSRRFKQLIQVYMAIIIVMTIALCIAFALQCIPARYFWNGTPGKIE